MSELSLNVAPSPELLKSVAGASPPAAPGKPPAAAGEAGSIPNPFAALLSGILQGTQPLAENPPGQTSAAAFPDLRAEAESTASGTSPLGLQGGAAPLPAPVTTAASNESGSLPGSLAGNLLPAGGKDLPPPPAAARTSARDSADATPQPAAQDRSRIFLGDLAQSRPVEPAPGLPVTTVADGARSAAAAALAGRSLATGASAPVETTSRPQAAVSYLDASGNIALQASATTVPLPVTDTLPLRSAAADLLRGAGLAGGGELLAGQLAAFAASNDTTNPAGGTPALTGAAPADAGSAALLGRLGSTGLPPLQPLGNAGGFAGGLADRLLTLGGPGTHSARLKLHPENLGALDVEITMDDGTAQVWFGTTTTQAREAIEASLPRLRELFADQGIQLTRTQVDTGSGQQGQSGSDQQRRMAPGMDPWAESRPGQSLRATPALGAAGGPAVAGSARLLDVWA